MGWDGSSGLGPREDGISVPLVATNRKFRGSHSNTRAPADPIAFKPASQPIDKSPTPTTKTPPFSPKPGRSSRIEAYLIDDKWVLGWKRKIDNKTFIIKASLTTKGIPYSTNTKYKFNNRVTSMPVTSWNGGILGPAEFTYPHPKGWTLNHSGTPLDKLTVKHLTAIFTSLKQVQPSCKSAWEKLLGQIDWQTAAVRYSSKVLTPRDWASHFKLILHRAFFTRTINPKAPSSRCRCCHREPERIVHFAKCSKIAEVWKYYDRLTKVPLKSRSPTYRLFGTIDNASLPLALLDLHTLTWKYILLAMVQVDLDNLPFSPSKIWKQVLHRYIRAVNSTTYHAQSTVYRTNCRGDPLSSAPINHLRKYLHPLAYLDNTGRLTWTRAMRTEFANNNIRLDQTDVH
jgi:hypothetical protein